MRTTLESGAWIDHRPIQDLVGKDKRTLARIGKADLSGAISGGGEVDMAAVISGLDMYAWMADRQDAVWALMITAWSFTAEDGSPLPVPEITGDEITGAESLDLIPLDDYNEIEALLKPHQDKLSRRPDPKGTTTSSSNGSSRGKAAASPKG